MDFRNRGVGAPVSQTTSSSPTSGGNFNKSSISRWVPLALAALAVVAVAFVLFTYLGKSGQTQYLNKKNYQAVFLNNGQVYFGNIQDFNDKYVNLTNIYYLQTNNSDGQQQQQASSNTNVSLVKLGCELHAPFDRMVINSEQVLFWENLKDDSQVVKAIAQYKKDNPNGQTCNNSTNSTQQAPNSSTPQNSTTPSNNSNSNTRTP